MRYSQSDSPSDEPWVLRLICCGRDDGYEYCDDWPQADTFRRSYCDAEGHDRTAILSRV